MKQNLKICLYLILALSLATCGKKKGDSAFVTLGIIPESPIVINADNENESVKGPYFKFQVKVKMEQEVPFYTLSITVLEVEVTGTNAKGDRITKKHAIEASKFNFATDTLDCKYSDFGQFDKNGNSAGTGGLFNDLSLYSVPTQTGTGGTCPTLLPVFVVGDGPGGKENTNFRYTVKIKPIGWFGSRTAPQGRFDGSATIYTQ